tara:strand:- start:355 stop:615 length:261 start_codon:yes stop_codon:yes gene_type:complete
MRKVILLVVFLIFAGCAKDEECVILLNKEESNGNFYFYFRPNLNYLPRSQPNSIGSPGLNANYASGKVSRELYDQYSIGEEYCFEI